MDSLWSLIYLRSAHLSILDALTPTPAALAAASGAGAPGGTEVCAGAREDDTEGRGVRAILILAARATVTRALARMGITARGLCAALHDRGCDWLVGAGSMMLLYGLLL